MTNCSHCNIKPAFALCGNCSESYYCDKDCQVKHWHSEHRFICDVIVERRKHFREYEPSKKNVPSWLPTKSMIDSVPPIPSSLLKDLKSEYEIIHVKRMRKVKWLEGMVEGILKRALLEKGLDEQSIGTILSTKEEFKNAFANHAQSGSKNMRDIETLVTRFDLMISAALGQDIKSMQFPHDKSETLGMCQEVVHHVNTMLKIFPNDSMYKDDEETRSMGFEPNSQFEGQDEDIVSEEELRQWYITEKDMANFAKHKYEPIEGFCDEYDQKDPGFDEDDPDLHTLLEGVDNMTQGEFDWLKANENHKTVKKIVRGILNDTKRARDDNLKLPADQRVARKRRNVHQSGWKWLAMVIICGGKEKTGFLVNKFWNGCLKMLLYMQPADPFDTNSETGTKYKLSRRRLWTGMLVAVSVLATSFFAYGRIQTSVQEGSAVNIIKATKERLMDEVESISTSNTLNKQLSDTKGELFNLQEQVGKARQGQRILLNPEAVKNGNFLLSNDIFSAIALTDGPIAYASEVKRFIGSSYYELKSQYISEFGSEIQFPDVAKAALNTWRTLKEKLDSGQTIESLQDDFKALAINIEHSNNVYSPGLKRFLSFIEERIGLIIGKYEVAERTAMRLEEQLVDIHSKSLSSYLDITVESAKEKFAYAAKEGTFKIPEPAQTNDSYTPGQFFNLASNLLSVHDGLLARAYKTFQDPMVQDAISRNMFFGDNLLGQILNMSATGVWAMYFLRGGFRVFEILAASLAWSLGTIADIFSHLARQLIDLETPEGLVEALSFQIDNISRTSGFASSLGFSICALISTITRSGEFLAGGVSVLFKAIADTALKQTIASSLISVALLIIEPIAYAFFDPNTTPGWLARYVISTKIPSLGIWAISMIVLTFYNGSWNRILFTPFTQFSEYRQSLPSNRLFLGGITKGGKKYHWTEYPGLLIAGYSISLWGYNGFMALQSFIMGDYARILNQVATGNSTKLIGQGANATFALSTQNHISARQRLYIQDADDSMDQTQHIGL